MGKDIGSFDFNFISSPSEAHCPAIDKNWVSWHIQYDLLCCWPVENDPAYNEWLNVSFCLNCLWLQIRWMFLLSCKIHWIFPLSCITIMALSFVFQNSSICPSDFSHWLTSMSMTLPYVVLSQCMLSTECPVCGFFHFSAKSQSCIHKHLLLSSHSWLDFLFSNFTIFICSLLYTILDCE